MRVEILGQQATPSPIHENHQEAIVGEEGKPLQLGENLEDFQSGRIGKR